MKKTLKTMLAFMAVAMVFTACNKDDIYENIDEQNPSSLNPMTFTASMEGQDGATRATIDGLDIKWTTGDKISIFDGSEENNGNQEFTLATGDGTTYATFTGSAASASTYYALYPYMASFSEDRVPTKKEAMAAGGVDEWDLEYWKDNIEKDENGVIEEMGWRGISNENQAFILDYLKNQTRTFKSGVQRNGNQFKDVVFPAEQTVAEGQCVDPKAMLMIGESDDYNSLKFKNVCAYVKVTPEFDCTTIRFISKGTEKLAGTVTLDYNNGDPTANVTANGVSTVTLTGTIKTGNDYYIAVLPATLNSGFTIRFFTTDAIYEKSTTKALTLTRNNVINLGSFATSGLNLVPITGSATRTGGTNVNWVQLWEDGPKFAEYNVGVTDGKAESYGCYYTWGGSKDKGSGDYYSGSGNLSGDSDTATKLWGSEWRMPTKTELEALFNSTNCTVEEINNTDAKGLLFKGKEGTVFASNSVFLPAGGAYYWDELHYSGDYGYYWSSTNVYQLDFSLSWHNHNVESNTKGYNYTVRAVLAE